MLVSVIRSQANGSGINRKCLFWEITPVKRACVPQRSIPNGRSQTRKLSLRRPSGMSVWAGQHQPDLDSLKPLTKRHILRNPVTTESSNFRPPSR